MARLAKLTWLRPESEDLLHLDVLRVFAATMIVVYHFQRHLSGTSILSRFVSHFTALPACVDLFFFISGFVITRFYGAISNRTQYVTFLRKRIARLYPLHLATMMIFVGIGIAAHINLIHLRLPDQFAMRCLIPNFLLIHSLNLCSGLSFNPVSWSISAEMILYAVFPLLLLARRRGHLFTLSLVVGAFVLLTWCAGPRSSRPWYRWTYDFGVLRALPSFLLGMTCFDFRRQLARVKAPAVLMWSSLALFVVLMVLSAPPLIILPVLYGIGIFGIAADEQRQQSRVIKVIAPFGLLTYSLYMLHPVVDIAFLSLIGGKMLSVRGDGRDILVAICFFLTYPVAWASLQLFESPARAWLTGARPRQLPIVVPQRASIGLPIVNAGGADVTVSEVALDK